MKREEIKAIFAEATDEQINSVMNLHGADIETSKKRVTALEAELKEKKEAFEKLNGEFETLKTANASGEDWKSKFEALKAENAEKERKAEEDRVRAEKAADVEKRFVACVGEKKFSHEAIKADYLRKFSEALDGEEYKGKGDTEIFHALTKDDASAFVGVTGVRIPGGSPQGGGTEAPSIVKIF